MSETKHFVIQNMNYTQIYTKLIQHDNFQWKNFK